MRIAVLTNAYPPKTQGGAGRIASEYTKILEGLGHEVKVYGPIPDFFELAKKSAFERLRFHLGDPEPRRVIVKEIAGWKPDLLISHNLTGCGFGTPREIQAAGARWWHVLHDVQLFEPSGQMVLGESHPLLRRIWRRYWARVRRRALGTPDLVISPTCWLLGRHEAYGFFGRTEKTLVANPVKLSEEGIAAPRDPRQIIFVGRLDPDKGIQVLLDAWERIKDVASRLVIVGSGSMAAGIVARQDARILVTGQKDPPEVARLMRESGILVLPSLVAENQPTVILEALAAGCAVAAADVGGTRETLGQAGELFMPGSAESLAQSIRKILEGKKDPAWDEEKRRILQLHDPETVAGVLSDLLRSKR